MNEALIGLVCGLVAGVREWWLLVPTLGAAAAAGGCYLVANRFVAEARGVAGMLVTTGAIFIAVWATPRSRNLTVKEPGRPTVHRWAG